MKTGKGDRKGGARPGPDQPWHPGDGAERERGGERGPPTESVCPVRPAPTGACPPCVSLRVRHTRSPGTAGRRPCPGRELLGAARARPPAETVRASRRRCPIAGVAGRPAPARPWLGAAGAWPPRAGSDCLAAGRADRLCHLLPRAAQSVAREPIAPQEASPARCS